MGCTSSSLVLMGDVGLSPQSKSVVAFSPRYCVPVFLTLKEHYWLGIL